jgi:hypothetical protein
MVFLHPSTARQPRVVAAVAVRKRESVEQEAEQTAEQQTLLPHLRQPIRAAAVAGQTAAAVFLALVAQASSSSVTHSVWHKDFK